MIQYENKLIHGDSLTVLRQMEPESVDAIITDPPYGINYVSQTGARIKNDTAPFIWFLYDAFRVLKSGSSGRDAGLFHPLGRAAGLYRRDPVSRFRGQKRGHLGQGGARHGRL